MVHTRSIHSEEVEYSLRSGVCSSVAAYFAPAASILAVYMRSFFSSGISSPSGQEGIASGDMRALMDKSRRNTSHISHDVI